MPISRLNTKIRLTMLCLSGFDLYSCWVPLVHPSFWKSGTYHVLSFKRIPEVAPILVFTSK